MGDNQYQSTQVVEERMSKVQCWYGYTVDVCECAVGITNHCCVQKHLKNQLTLYNNLKDLVVIKKETCHAHCKNKICIRNPQEGVFAHVRERPCALFKNGSWFTFKHRTTTDLWYEHTNATIDSESWCKDTRLHRWRVRVHTLCSKHLACPTVSTDQRY